jgi:hypothetical protein
LKVWLGKSRANRATSWAWWIKHQLEELVTAGEQRDAAAKIRLMPDTR